MNKRLALSNIMKPRILRIRALPAGILLVSLMLPCRAIAGPDAAGAETVEVLIQRNEAQLQRVLSVVYDFAITGRYHEEPTTRSRVGSAKQRGDLAYEFVEGTTTQLYGDGRTEQRRNVAYVGPTSAAHWNQSGAAAVQYEYATPETMSDRARSDLRSVGPPHPERYAFGNGQFLLRDLWRRTSDQAPMYRWEAERTQEELTAYARLSLYASRGGRAAPHAASQLWLDPAKAYTVVRVIERLPSGQLLRTVDTTLTDVTGEGHWYPSLIVERYFGSSSAGRPPAAGEPVWSTQTTISNVRIGVTFKEADFSLDALGLPDGTPLIRRLPDGARVDLRRNGEGFEVVGTLDPGQPAPQPSAPDGVPAAEAGGRRTLEGVQIWQPSPANSTSDVLTIVLICTAIIGAGLLVASFFRRRRKSAAQHTGRAQ